MFAESHSLVQETHSAVYTVHYGFGEIFFFAICDSFKQLPQRPRASVVVFKPVYVDHCGEFINTFYNSQMYNRWSETVLCVGTMLLIRAGLRWSPSQQLWTWEPNIWAFSLQTKYNVLLTWCIYTVASNLHPPPWERSAEQKWQTARWAFCFSCTVSCPRPAACVFSFGQYLQLLMVFSELKHKVKVKVPCRIIYERNFSFSDSIFF